MKDRYNELHILKNKKIWHTIKKAFRRIQETIVESKERKEMRLGSLKKIFYIM